MTKSELQKKWQLLHNNPELRDSLRPEIRDSWKRSYKQGIDPHLLENPYICTTSELARARIYSNYLLEKTEPIMENLHQLVAGQDMVIVLTDPNLCVLKVLGDSKALAWAKSAQLVEGSMWSEKLVGTNSAALCENTLKPESVFGYEHFCFFSHFAADSYAPIFNQGKICGGLSMVSPYNLAKSHTLGMVVTAANYIASMLYLETLEKINQDYETVMQSMSEGIMVLNSCGNVTYANESCIRLLQLPRQSILGCNISSLLGTSIDNHHFINQITQGNTIIEKNFKLATIGDRIINCNVTCLNSSDISSNRIVVIFKEKNHLTQPCPKLTINRPAMTFDKIAGNSANFLHTIRKAKKSASSLSNVLLLGETGTGKDAIAQAIHNASPRKDNPYIAINCAALPRELIASELFGYNEGAFTGAKKGGHSGKFELADGGTIFLDEIGDMPLELQASLLRVLEEKVVFRLGGNKPIPVNVRIIAATNKDLQTEIKCNRFRRDLFYRLAVIKITIPPLRKRPEDILLLAEKFIRKTCQQFSKPPMIMTSEATDAFLRYSWPGNIREMQNIIESAVQLAPGNVITYNLIADYISDEEVTCTSDFTPISHQDNSSVIALEKQMLSDYLVKYKYNKSKVARALGISRNTLYRRLDKYNLS
jgi:transcriptional regulator with PAS, ATPase and Fis domain